MGTLRIGFAVAVLVGLPALLSSQGAASFEVVGRGPITNTHTTDLVVFRGVDGRDYAYTGTWGGCRVCVGDRIYAWDVSDPASPVLTDSVLLDATIVGDLAVNAEGTLAVVTRQQAQSRRNGIAVLDLADPAHPRVHSQYFEGVTGGVQNVAIDGSLLYAVSSGTTELHVIDLADPADPRQVGQWGLPAGATTRYLEDVVVQDGMAYLSYWDDGLVILDIGEGGRGGTPRNPVQVGQYRYRTEFRRGEFGNTAVALPHTNSAGNRYVFVGDRIFPDQLDFSGEVETAGYIHVVDVRRPESPVEVARFDVPGAGVRKLWAAGDTLYATFHGGGLRAVDISGTLQGNLRGREIASLRTADGRGIPPERPFAWGVQGHEGYVFASDFNSGLWVTRLAPTP
ncbi:MAG: hypothetical protein M3483_05835 [Gemmatimonadota bacterium]|nr:hypothetical protein [Gemmatimonadota bacterium]